MAGVDAVTGKRLEGYDHVQQSLEKILTTWIGARTMREWVGNPGLRLLGKNMTEETILVWFNTLYMLIELFEPRFRIKSFSVDRLSRQGLADFTMTGEYRPYAHLDWQQAKYFVSVRDGTVTLVSAI